jgi:tetratricopeptide (TPR) repeat protein
MKISTRHLILGLAATMVWTSAPMSPPAHAERPEASQAGSRYYEKAVRLARSSRFKKAITWFEKALPFYRDSSDLYYNLVNLTEATRQWKKLWTYGQAFLFLQPDGDDAQEVKLALKKAAVGLAKKGITPVSVQFDVTPPGVQVFVDDIPMARGKRAPARLLPGTYVAKASLEDHEAFESRFQVAPNVPMTVTGTLKKKIYFGFLAITTQPSDQVSIFINDELIGRSPLKEPIRLETRRYLIRFEKEGYDQWLRYVDIEREETYELTPIMEPAPSP